MRTQTSYALIGSFVIGGLVLFTVSLVALHAGTTREVIKAETLFEESVSGLEVGAPVRFRGVTIGRVTQITVAGALYQETEHTYVVVRFELWGPEGLPVSRLRRTLPARIEEGLRVRLASPGVTGIAYLEADILDDAYRYPPKDRDWMPDEQRERYLYIPSAPSALGEVVNSVEKVLDDVVRADLPQVAREIRDAAASIQQQLQDAGLGELRVEAKATLASVRSAASHAADDLARAVAGLETGIRDVGTAAQSVELRMRDPQIDAILRDVKAATTDLARVVGEAQTLLAGKAGDVAAILANLERATAHLRTLAATAEQYPSWLLFGTRPQGGGR